MCLTVFRSIITAVNALRRLEESTVRRSCHFARRRWTLAKMERSASQSKTMATNVSVSPVLKAPIALKTSTIACSTTVKMREFARYGGQSSGNGFRTAWIRTPVSALLGSPVSFVKCLLILHDTCKIQRSVTVIRVGRSVQLLWRRALFREHVSPTKTWMIMSVDVTKDTPGRSVMWRHLLASSWVRWMK